MAVGRWVGEVCIRRGRASGPPSALRRVGLATALAALLIGYGQGRADPPGPDDPPRAAPRPVAATQTDPIRQTEDEAVAHAVATGSRVEIGALRTETRSVFANPDGTLTEEQHTGPVRVVDDGRWVPTDPTLEVTADGSLVPRAAVFGLRLSGGGDGHLLTAERAGRTMSLDWPGTLPQPVLDGARATYREVLPGVDLVVDVGVTDFSHVLVIRDAEAARNPALSRIEFGLRTQGLAVHGADHGGLTVVDPAAGGAVFEAAQPMMWDSGDPDAAGRRGSRAATDPVEAGRAAVQDPPPSAGQAPVDVQVDHDTLTLTPDAAMLADTHTRWPVYVDPVYTDTRTSGWAMVASGYPSQEYWKFSGTEGVGECPVSSGWCNNTGRKRLFLALPTPYSGKTILKAELALTMTATYDGSRHDVSVYQATSGISSKTNWGNQPGLGTRQDTRNPTATRGECTKDNQNVRFNVLQAVKAAGKATTTTFGVRADDESDHRAWKRFCGSNALLAVTYNRAPYTPAQKDLSNSPGSSTACVYGTNRPYTDTAPTLKAVLRDPDHAPPQVKESIRAEFKISWTPAGGSPVVKTFQTGLKASGSPFTLDTNATKGLSLPQNTVIAWEVRAGDTGNAWGNWSSYGDQTRCEFVIDKTTPAAPDIDSPEYLPLDVPDKTALCVPDEQPAGEDGETSPSWRGWIGKYSSFTFDSSSDDVVEYQYGFDAAPSAANVLKPTTGGGPVTLPAWAPAEDGPHTISVKAIDRARKSNTATCAFYVATRLSAAEWKLDDDGPTTAADTRGRHPATAGAGVTFGVPGPACPAGATTCAVDRAVRLSGQPDGHLATQTSALVDTAVAFSVSAWVRLTDDTGDRAAVSQDGAGQAGFVLGFDGASRRWAFTTPASPAGGAGAAASTSTATAVKDRWTHLAGVYDPVKATVQLFVDGVAQPAVARAAGWTSTGAVQLGRRLDGDGYRAPWSGDLADVNVFDRIIVQRETGDLATQRPLRLAYWPLDGQTGGLSPPYDDPDGPELSLQGGAHVVNPDETAPPGESALVGTGHLVLDGTDDHARTDAVVVPTRNSYTVTARVRTAAPGCSRPQAVVSQAGSRESAFILRCAEDRWELVLPQLDGTDAARPPVVFHGDAVPSADPSGQHLAVVYDAFANQATLYVDGQVVADASGTFAAAWAATGLLNLGRTLRQGTYGDHFAGVVDDVRVYAGVVDEATVQRLAYRTPDPNL